MVTALRNDSGLTWDQLARLFGVSRRAVHFWASGGNMNSQNHQMASQLLSQVRALAGQSAEERRKEILMPRASGRSLFDEWKTIAATASQRVNPSPGVEASLGI